MSARFRSVHVLLRHRSLGFVLSTKRRSGEVDAAIMVVRVSLAVVFMYYGAGKLFGWFNGPGLQSTAAYFASTAHLHPGEFFAVVAGIIEFGGSLALMLGLGARVAGLALVVDQTVAIITVTGRNGFNSLSATPGYEFNLTLVALALVVVLLGASQYSLDTLLHRRLMPSTE